MLRSVFTKTLWEMRRALLGWTIGATAVGVLYAAFYPAIKAPEYAEMMESFAPELMEALGFTDFVSPAGYLGSTTFGILGPVLLIIFGAWFGTRAVAGDEDNGKLDVLLAHPVPRWRIVVERFGSLIVGAAIICLVLFAALLAISGPAEFADIGAANLLAGSTHLAALTIFFGGLALAVGAATGSRGLATGVVAIVGVLGYFGNTMSSQIQEIAWVRDISPFKYYAGGRPLANGFQAVDLTVLIVMAVVLVAIGTAFFSRRDVAV
jgi:ABC-2 type transport system permease protein